jgi:hypothetical protein
LCNAKSSLEQFKSPSLLDGCKVADECAPLLLSTGWEARPL